MERKTVAKNANRKAAGSATVWAGAALVVWSGVLVAAAAFSGLLGPLTRHDLLIAAVGAGFVVMASASVFLLRQDVNQYLSSARSQNRRTRH
ncbi:hypothetical protein NOF55_05500 [Rhizobiaceae bacterium BDR2-2]|uniref:Uncharacterized protein n=1 Tax=Ectorhizobium quercum TaxID=2965071 RepID=A0AAE3MYS9_9HYPH|nr:hypothetical protein [Ectorhizobium quercum]MCX8996554.1 hypothetical protein [Ectorhizobium quercum]